MVFGVGGGSGRFAVSALVLLRLLDLAGRALPVLSAAVGVRGNIVLQPNPGMSVHRQSTQRNRRGGGDINGVCGDGGGAFVV